jgi:single-strand DNA-binding protein
MLNITAHGNLGKDPEVKQVKDTQVAEFSLASRTGKDETTWINCAVWGARADVVAKYLYKGAKVTVVGSGKLRTYEKNDGSKGSSLELRVSDFTLPAKGDASSEGQSKSNFDF